MNLIKKELLKLVPLTLWLFMPVKTLKGMQNLHQKINFLKWCLWALSFWAFLKKKIQLYPSKHMHATNLNFLWLSCVEELSI